MVIRKVLMSCHSKNCITYKPHHFLSLIHARNWSRCTYCNMKTFIVSVTPGRGLGRCIAKTSSWVLVVEVVTAPYKSVDYPYKGLLMHSFTLVIKRRSCGNTSKLMPYHSSPFVRTHAFAGTSVKASLHNTTNNTEHTLV